MHAECPNFHEFCWFLYQVAHKNFMVCPAESFNPISPAFRRIEFIGFEFLRSLDLFPSEKQLLLEYLLFTASRCVSAHRQHVETGNECHKCICFQTCNHDTREDVDNHTTILFRLAHHRQGIFFFVTGLAFRLFNLFPPVCFFTFGTEEDACFKMRISCVSPLHTTLSSRSPVACVCRKLQASLLEQDPIVFRWKHSSVFRSV